MRPTSGRAAFPGPNRSMRRKIDALPFPRRSPLRSAPAFPSISPEPSLAITPHSDEAFLREVDEELRRDQLAGFWTRWGRWVIAAIVGGLAIFAGVLFWQQHQRDRRGDRGREAAGGVRYARHRQVRRCAGAARADRAVQPPRLPRARDLQPGGYRASEERPEACRGALRLGRRRYRAARCVP